MPKDQLFLLQPGFFKESEGPFYCGDSVAVEGLLSFFPQLRNEVDVHYIGAPRPRAAIVALIGADNQSAPVLVLLGIAVAKGWGITEQFMELRHGPLLWRLLIGGWVVVMALLLGSIFLFLSV